MALDAPLGYHFAMRVLHQVCASLFLTIAWASCSSTNATSGSEPRVDAAKAGERGAPLPTPDAAAVSAAGAAPETGHDDGSGRGGGMDANRPKQPAPPFSIVVGARTISVAEADLAKVPATTPPVGDQQTPGWELSAILLANGVAAKGRITLYDGDGVRVEIGEGDWDTKATRLFLKKNNKGQWRFRMYKRSGTGWNPTSELRGMAKIVVRQK